MFLKLGESLFNKKFDKFSESNPLPKHTFIAFLKQSNVVKHIYLTKNR